MTTQPMTTGDGIVLQARDLSFDYQHVHGKRTGHQNHSGIGPLNIDLYAGRITALIGASGCGKSTTLKLLAGILKPDHGVVTYEGRNLSRMSQSRRAKLRRSRFAFVFQDYMLIDSLSVAENVTLPVDLNGHQKHETGEKQGSMTQRALALVGLDRDLGEANVSELSGGQQQRVAIARALSMHAEILFADEPTGNLDPRAREDTLDAIGDAMQGGLKTCLLVTHDPQVAARADRVLYMNHGKVAHEFGRLDAAEVEELLLGHIL